MKDRSVHLVSWQQKNLILAPARVRAYSRAPVSRAPAGGRLFGSVALWPCGPVSVWLCAPVRPLVVPVLTWRVRLPLGAQTIQLARLIIFPLGSRAGRARPQRPAQKWIRTGARIHLCLLLASAGSLAHSWRAALFGAHSMNHIWRRAGRAN